ncbi:MAG: hypothetical protein NTZ33_08955 [Bacteroidetes bacterium]|nr:hypothetical protein [Bacteroidota bacterium]
MRCFTSVQHDKTGISAKISGKILFITTLRLTSTSSVTTAQCPAILYHNKISDNL